MFRLIGSLVVAFTLLGVGCSQDSGKPLEQPAGNAVLTADVDALKKEVQELKVRVGAIQELQTKVFQLELARDEFRTTWFDPTGAKGYQRVDANIGYFLVTLENVEPYLDGQRVTLLIGNPNSATFSGFEVKASWRIRAPTEGSKNTWAEWVNSQQEKVIKLTDTLRAGTWNKVTFIIAPAKAEQFGSLGIAITTNQIVLAGGR
jgi:hypothetical protein